MNKSFKNKYFKNLSFLYSYVILLQVRVCWAEGHTSMCWPQDLYKVGDYDSDEGELWDDATSEDGSWMTDSEEPTASDVDKIE